MAFTELPLNKQSKSTNEIGEETVLVSLFFIWPIMWFLLSRIMIEQNYQGALLMHKKGLQIQTQFLGEDELPSLALTQSEKKQSAVFVEKVLSCILARNFIDCWEALKHYFFHHRGSQRQTLRVQDAPSKSVDSHSKYRIKTHEENTHIKNLRHNRTASNQKFTSVHQQESDQYYYESYKSRPKTVRGVNRESEYERAHVLEEIVEKLKNRNKGPDFSSQIGLEVLKKVSKLERMMKDIKIANRSERIEIRNIEQTVSNEEQTLQKFTKEIQDIRYEITGIRKNNEEILKLEEENNRLSRISERDRIERQVRRNESSSINKGNSYLQKADYMFKDSFNYQPSESIAKPTPSSHFPIYQPPPSTNTQTNPPFNLQSSHLSSSNFQTRQNGFTMNSQRYGNINESFNHNQHRMQARQPDRSFGGAGVASEHHHWQATHKNSSNFPYQSERSIVDLPNYCQACGRSCDCRRTFISSRPLNPI